MLKEKKYYFKRVFLFSKTEPKCEIEAKELLSSVLLCFLTAELFLVSFPTCSPKLNYKKLLSRGNIFDTRIVPFLSFPKCWPEISSSPPLPRFAQIWISRIIILFLHMFMFGSLLDLCHSFERICTFLSCQSF